MVVGLFTWLVSIGSAGFLVMFTLSAMLGWDKFWALPASIALLNGAGRTFGLDYWAVPWFQNILVIGGTVSQDPFTETSNLVS